MKRTSIRLDPDQAARLEALAVEQESSVAGQVRRAVRLLLDQPEDGGERFDPAEWRVDGEPTEIGWGTVKGQLRVYSLRRRRIGHEGAHAIVQVAGHTADGRLLLEPFALVVAPDGITSGLRRSRTILEACRTAVDAPGIDRGTYVAGACWMAGATRMFLVDTSVLAAAGVVL